MRVVNGFSYRPSNLLATNQHMVTKSTRKIRIIKDVKLRTDTQKGKGGKEDHKNTKKSK